jgi:hypothetical protein
MAKKSTSLLQLMEQNKYLTFWPDQNRNPCSTSYSGDFDVNEIVGFSGSNIIATRADMNHASEIFSFDMKKSWKQLSNVTRLSMILWR